MMLDGTSISMRRLLSHLGLALALLMAPAVVATAPECSPDLCLTNEEVREGGHCEAADGQSASYYRYYNATIRPGEGPVAVEVRSVFQCENEQPRPDVSGEWDRMHTQVVVMTPGRADEAWATISYGTIKQGCIAGAAVDPDRTLIFNFGPEGAGTTFPCGGSQHLPSVTELLP